MDNDNPKDVAYAMSKFVNTYLSRNAEFIDEMSREHRTLQQGFTRLCVQWLEYLATVEHYDLRNEASVSLGKEFVEKIENRHLPYV